MRRLPKQIFLFLLAVIAVAGILLYGCSANTSNQSTSTTQSSQSPSPSGQSRANAAGMQTMLTQVAQELGIPEDKLAAAYQQAQDSVVSSMPPRNPPSQGQGQQSPNASGQGQQSPNTSGQSQNFNDFRMSIYNKMADILNIPADQIATAFSKFQPQFPSSRGPATNQ